MSAQALLFSEYLQQPLEAGALTAVQAWALVWERTALLDSPWTPGVFEVYQRTELFHWEPDSLPQ